MSHEHTSLHVFSEKVKEGFRSDPLLKPQAEHCERVSKLACEVAKRLKIKAESFLCECATVHDCGKLLVDRGILCREGPISDEEYGKIQKHIGYTRWLIKESNMDPETINRVLAVVMPHHEICSNFRDGPYPRNPVSNYAGPERRLLNSKDGSDTRVLAEILAFCDQTDRLVVGFGGNGARNTNHINRGLEDSINTLRPERRSNMMTAIICATPIVYGHPITLF